jgi:alpha-L-arabinofuranosidase
MLNMLILSHTLSTTITLDLNKPGVPVSPTLYGLMTEEINHSYDGGLYAELIRNRSFQDNTQNPVFWKKIGEQSELSLQKGNGATDALPAQLIFKGAIANEGFWGFPIQPKTTYQLSLWAKSATSSSIQASIESPDGKIVFAKTSLSGINSNYKKLTGTLKTSSTVKPTTDAIFVLRSSPDQTVNLSLVSLFPPTHKRRANGNRIDLMKMMIDMKPKFLRFPGGNYLEGPDPANRFPWKQTLGPIETRAGHQTPWGYRSSDGMGLLEFLLWAEDVGAEPVLGVYAGYALNKQYAKPGPELQPFVDEALEEIEYCIGGPDTKWGARRIKDGHPKPFPLRYVEVGNEDGFDDSGSYEARFVQFYDAIKKKYPQIQVISTTGGKDWLGLKFPITQRKPDLWDEHYYSNLWDMMSMATKYDSYDRKGPAVFVGEWAAFDGKAPWEAGATAGPTPNFHCALAEAAFMTGLERNSDIVKMACYAPLLVNVNPGGRQWAINMIGYDAISAYGSPSYYLQVMFANNLGDQTVPLTLAGAPTIKNGDRTLPGIFASATRDKKSGTIYFKLVNTTDAPQTVSTTIKGDEIGSSGTEIIMTGDPKAENSLADPLKVAPTTKPVKGLSNTFNRTLPAHSITVLKLNSKR